MPRSRLVILVPLAVAVLVSCGGTSGPPPTTSDIEVTFAQGASSVLSNTGAYGDTVEVTLVVSGTTKAKTTEGPGGKAIELPHFSAATGSAHSVVKISNNASPGGDRLSTGTRNFSFGADFDLDPAPTAREPSVVDDGDNLMQRGLYGERSQYKIELDTRSPTCSLHGRAGGQGYRGVLDIRAARGFPAGGVASGTWYRVRCSRTGPSSAELTLSQLGADGSMVRTWTTTDIAPAMPSGAVLDLTPADAGIPLSVGGKLDDQGHLVTGESVDQFNGSVDNVTFDIG